MNAARQEKIKELESELSSRRWIYNRRVKAGKMSVREAGRKIRIMQEILDDYLREGDLFGMGSEQ